MPSLIILSCVYPVVLILPLAFLIRICSYYYMSWDLPEMVSLCPFMSHLGNPALALPAAKLSHEAYRWTSYMSWMHCQLCRRGLVPHVFILPWETEITNWAFKVTVLFLIGDDNWINVVHSGSLLHIRSGGLQPVDLCCQLVIHVGASVSWSCCEKGLCLLALCQRSIGKQNPEVLKRGLKLREMCWRVHCDLPGCVISDQGMVILAHSQMACNLVCSNKDRHPVWR